MKRSFVLLFGFLFFSFPLTSVFPQSEVLTDMFGYNADAVYSTGNAPFLLYNRIISKESNMGWTSGNHTGAPVPLGVLGPEKYASQLHGVIENTEIARVLKDAARDGMNVIFVLGDGMGVSLMNLAIAYRIASGSTELTQFEKIMREGNMALVLNHNQNTLTTCSSSSGTAYACGEKTLFGIAGIDYKGNRLESVLDAAEQSGNVTGLITDAEITDATPTVFYAHVIDRQNDDEIARQLAEDNNIEVIFGGGLSYFLPGGMPLRSYEGFSDFPVSLADTSKRKDNRNLLDDMKQKGYTVINTRDDLLNLKTSQAKVIGLFAPGGIAPCIDRDDEVTNLPSLVDLAKTGIGILQSYNKPYFLLIESARIDWEAHLNDAGSVFKAVLETNDILKYCYDVYKENPEKTILVFTADHETGGFEMTFSGYPDGKKETKTLESGDVWETRTNGILFADFLKLAKQKMSLAKIFDLAESPEHLYTLLKENTGYTVTEDEAEMIFDLLEK